MLEASLCVRLAGHNTLCDRHRLGKLKCTIRADRLAG